MPSKYTGLSVCDLSTIQFLKKKQFKSFPGGIFSIIFILLNLGILITMVLLCILEPLKMRPQIYKPAAVPVQAQISVPDNNGDTPSNTINIDITLTSKTNDIDTATLDSIDSHFILVRYYRIGFKIHARLYQGIKKQQSQFNNKLYLAYQVPVNELLLGEREIGFPRLAIESCAFFNEDKAQKDFYLIVDNPELISKCPSKEDFDKFYDLPLIKGNFFEVAFTSDYYQLQTDFTIKSLKKTYELYFEFVKMRFDSYITELNRISLQTNRKSPAVEYNNWLYPDYQVLAQFAINNHYSFHMLLSSKYKDMGIRFVLYKYGVMYYLQNLGAVIRTVDILTFIPSIWIPYYSSLLIIKYYAKMEEKKAADKGKGKDDNGKDNEDISIEEEYDWSKLGYCQWLSIKFGCSFRKRKLNQRINEMRYLVSAEFEKLYSNPNKDRDSIKTEEENKV